MRPVIIVPLAGRGSRFPKEKWFLPKPLILVDDYSIIEWSMQCIDSSDCDLIFVVRSADVEEFSIDSFLKQKFKGCTVVIIPDITRGAIETCMAAKKYIRQNDPLVIHCSDVFFQPKIRIAEFKCEHDGCILTFKSNSSNYSYSQIDDKGFVTKVAEKKVISENASAGLYWFKNGEDFIRAAKRKISAFDGSELHIAPLYNTLIEENKKISVQAVDKMHIFGTPEEFDFFTKNSLKTFADRKNKVVLASDHSGFDAKNIFAALLRYRGIKYVDVGCNGEKDCDYNSYVKAAAKMVLENRCDFGFLFCRSGQGVNIAANKIKGIRSAWVNNEWLAEQAIKHNCCNIFAISSNLNTEESMAEILNTWANNSFDGGRHQNRLMANET